MRPKNSFVKISIWIVSLMLGYAIVQSMYEASLNKSRLDAYLKWAAAVINTNLPMMIDAENKLEKVVPSSGKLIFYISLPNVNKEDVDVPVIKTNMLQSLISNYKTNSTKQKLREQNVVLDYQYKDKNGELIFEIAISPRNF